MYYIFIVFARKKSFFGQTEEKIKKILIICYNISGFAGGHSVLFMSFAGKWN